MDIKNPNAILPMEPAIQRRVGRRRKTDAGASLKDRILDAGENLFSQNGYHGVTVRAVAEAAGVDAALAHYYFRTKDGLFAAVFERRAAIVNEARMASMDAYEASAGARATTEGWIEAFLGPAIDLWAKGGPQWKAYFRLVALVNNTPQWGGATMGKYFDPVIQRLMGGLKKVKPALRDDDLYWGYHFLSGALTLTFAETGRLDRLSGGKARSADHLAVRKRMAKFFAAGYAAMGAKA